MSLNKERAWEVLNNLSFVRVTGTDEELRAAELIKAEFEKAGVEAHFEEYEIEMPEIIKAEFEVVEPVAKKFHVIGIGKTGQTSEEGVECGFVYAENATDANLTDVKGKIVMVQGRTGPDFAKKLVEKGAAGYIAIAGTFLDSESLKEELRPRNAFGPATNCPGLVIHMCDAEELVRMHPTKVKFTLLSDAEKKGTSRNVVGTIEGTDLKDEIIAISGHYDSVPYSPGAWDNMTGTVNVLELMHYFAANKPRRTIKFIACGSEEIGLVGSRKYCEAHKDEMNKYIFNINFDMTGVTLGYEYCCVSASAETKANIDYLAKLENYPLQTKIDLYASDSSSFANAGVPSCTFARLAPMGGATIHNHYDTMEHLDADSFMITLNFAAKFADQLANTTINLIPRTFDDELKKKFEERKKMMAMFEGKKEEKKEEPKEEPKKEEEAK